MLWELGNRKALYLLKALHMRLENTEGQHFMCVKFQSASNQNMGKTPNINLQAKKQMIKYYKHLKIVTALLVISEKIICFLKQ